jgi:hypothetical protein
MTTHRKAYRTGHSGYVSEFEQYMDHFLEEHPDVVNEQRQGWNIHWDHKVDLEELEKANEDSVPMKKFLEH